MSNGLREVYIIGAGQSKFGKQPHIDGIDLGVIAAQAAIESCGIDPRKFQIAYASRIEEASTTAQDVLRHLSVQNIECHNVENACGSGGSACRLMWKDIAYGVCDVGIVVGLESLSTSPLAGGLVPSANTSILNQLGFPAPGNVGMTCHALMESRGATLEDLAYASVKSHRVAQYNPYAHIKKQFTLEDVVNSEMIASPITKYMCAPMSDGAAAVIMCTKEIAYQYTNNPVRVDFTGMRTGAFLKFNDDYVFHHEMQHIAREAYEYTGVDPSDLDVLEIHDAFSPEELFTYELLHLCPPGDSVKMVRDGVVDVGGRHPVNMSGGLLSLGHPLAASGVRVMGDLFKQLRGEAPPPVQVKDAKVGLAQMVGGQLPGRTAQEANYISILSI